MVYQDPDEPKLRIAGRANVRFAIAARGWRHVATASGTATGGTSWSGTAEHLWGHGSEEPPMSFSARARFDPATSRVDVAPVPGLGDGMILPFTASGSFDVIARRCTELPTEVAQLRTATAEGAPAANAVI